MPISVDSTVDVALAESHFEYALCVQLPGGYNVTNNPDSLTVGGVTYTPDEILLGSSGTKRKYDISADSAEVTLGNADQTMYQDYVSNTYEGQPVVVLAAFVDDEFQRISANSYMVVYEGVLESWAVNEGTTKSELKIKITSHWSAWRVQKGRRTNSGSQNSLYPTDTVFEYSHMEELPFKWGL